MKKFENIVIASDLDGTYFGSDAKPVARNIEKVRYFREKGGHFTFATGRTPLFIQKPIPTPKDHINMPAVMGNGTAIFDYSTNRVLEEHFLESKDVVEIIKYARSMNSGIGARATFAEGFVLPDIDNPINRDEYNRLPDFMDKRIIPLEEWTDLNFYKANIIADDESIDIIYPSLKKHFDGRVAITRSTSFAIEVIPFGISKASALGKLVSSYFKDDVTLYCVGDYDNDIEMLKLADVAVCPSNANNNVKNICKYCLCSNDDGVIGELIDLIET